MAVVLGGACRRGPFPGDAVLDSSGCTPLMAAAMAGDADAARRAIAARCDPERTWQGKAPLHWAAWRGHQGVVDVLLDAGVNIDTRAEHGEYALQLAIESGNVPLVRDLLARGAEARNGELAPALLHRAARGGSAELLELVLGLGLPVDGLAAPWWDEPPQTALHVACTVGNTAAARALLEHGAGIDVRTEEGWTPLHLAAGGGHVDVVALLLDRAADVRAVDALGRTAVHVAAELDRAPVLALVQQRLPADAWRALAQTQDRFGRTPLHLAAWAAGRVSVDELLPDSDLAAGTKALGWRPAHLAALADDAELMRRLMPDGEAPPRDALGRAPADLLRAQPDVPRTPDGPRLALPSGAEGTSEVVRWFQVPGYVMNPWQGRVVAVWQDGVYLRTARGPTAGVEHDYRVGVLDPSRMGLLLEELRETGWLSHPAFSRVAVDTTYVDLMIRTPDGEMRWEFGAAFHPPSGPGELPRDMPDMESRRALGVLKRVRAAREDPLELHLIDGAFRGIRPGSQHLPR